MDLIITYIIGRWGEDVAHIATRVESARYAADVLSRRLCDYGGHEFRQEVQNIQGTPAMEDGRAYCWLVYRMAPHGTDLVRVQFHPTVVQRLPPWQEWAEKVQCDHLLGASNLPQCEENIASRTGIGANPGSGWPGWAEQVRSLTSLPVAIIKNRAGRVGHGSS